MKNSTFQVLSDIGRERKAQDKKWGDQSGHSLYKWLTILAEEVGELAEAALYGYEYETKARDEAIHVAAVAAAIAEQLDRNQGGS